MSSLLGFDGHPYTSTLVYSEPTHGKAQSLDSQVLTPRGPAPFYSLKPGDSVLNASGEETEIVGVFPQGKRDLYRVTFKDGASTETCREHLWYTRSTTQRIHKLTGSVRALADVMSSLRIGDGRANHAVPYTKPLRWPTKSQPLAPYLLGALIGDGSFHGPNPTLTCAEPDVRDRAFGLLPDCDTYLLVSDSANCPSYRIKRRSRNNALCFTAEVLADLGLADRSSFEKFIPTLYLFGDIQQRQAILAGLLDTDGSVCIYDQANVARGTFEYSSTSERLAREVVFLVRSLGGRASLSSRFGKYTKNGVTFEARENWRVSLAFPDGYCPARSEKHTTRFAPPRKQSWHAIDSVEFSRREEAACIAVRNPNGLYVTDDCIVTHNTTFAATAPKPMKVFFFDQKGKETPYLKRGKIIEEGINDFKIPFVKIGSRKSGKHIITIEYFRNPEPEKPTAYPLFLRSMSTLREDLEYYNTFVLDSVTYLEKAARWHDQFVTNVGARDKRQHYITSAEAVEMQVMGRFASLPKNSIVICHVLEKKNKDGEDESKQRFGSKQLFVPAAPGAKARQLPSAFGEIYRAFVSPKGEFMLQTKTDGMWLAATQIEAPNPCPGNWQSLWENFAGYGE